MALNDDDTTPDPLDARIARLYREAALEEPPAHLDRSIAQAARDVRRSAAAERPRPWWMAWRLPVAFAAVAIVSVSLVTLIVEERGDRFTDVPRPAPPAASPAARDEIQPRSEVNQTPLAAPPAPAASAPARKEAGAIEGKLGQERAQAETPPPEPFPAQRRDEPAADNRIATPDASPRALRKSGPTESAAAPAADAGLAARAPQAKAESEVRALEDRQRSASGAAPMSTPQPQMSPPAPPQPPAGRAVAPAPAAKPPAPSAKSSIGIRGTEFGALEGVAPSPEVAAHIRELEKQPPSAWIDRVLALRREGKRAEADGLLAELRRRYPAEPLPSELQ